MTYIPKKNRQTIPITDKGKTISNTKPITGNKPKSVCVKGDTRQSFIREKKDDYFQLRMNSEWKNKVKTISEMNNISFSNFIRQSVDKNIQSLST